VALCAFGNSNILTHAVSSQIRQRVFHLAL
jgi:hypothetical protein